MKPLHEIYNEAENLKDAGKPDEAIVLLLEVLERDPAHVLSHLTLARIYTLSGEFDLAIEHGQKACELEPNDSFNHMAMSKR